MKPSFVRAYLKDLPYMEFEQGQRLFDFILSHKLVNCLELGFYHGVSSAYIAGALHEMGDGQLVTIDTVRAKQLKPNIEELIRGLGLEDFVTYYFEPSSYTWRLMKFLQDPDFEKFDFCYIDGGHTWDTTGFAYFLVSRLLKPGGWILFDDLNWTHQNPAVRNTPRVKAMAEDERSAAQVRLVYELLVKRDPQFTDFFTEGSWGYAKKQS
jgi:predicted O-methyltransferase YrrM